MHETSSRLRRRSLLSGISWGAAAATLACLGTVAASSVQEAGSPNWPWLASRATGFVAYALLWATTVTGIATSLQRERPSSRAVLQNWHRTMNQVTWVLVGIHVAALLFESHVGYSIVDLVVPFASSEGGMGLAAGIVAAELAAAVAMTFSARRFLGPRLWRTLHLLAYPAWALTWAHLMFAGSSMDSLWVRFTVLASGLAVLLLACLRGAVAIRILPRPTAERDLTTRERRTMAAVSAGGALVGLATALVLVRTPADRVESPPSTAPSSPAVTDSNPGPEGVTETPEPITRSRGS